MTHLGVSDLRITYRDDLGQDFAAVECATFSMERGDMLGIVGESGSGKSTLARALLGYARYGGYFASGKIRVGNTDVLALQGNRLRRFRGGRVAMVPQNPLSSLAPGTGTARNHWIPTDGTGQSAHRILRIRRAGARIVVDDENRPARSRIAGQALPA